MKTDDIRAILAGKIEASLLDKLLAEFQGVKEQFYLGDYESTGLKAGRFAEAATRVLEQVSTGSYTSFGRRVDLNTLTAALESDPKFANLSASFRIHIPRILRVVYDIRNRRGIGHLSKIDANLMDASLVIACCDWIMAELVAIYGQMQPKLAQTTIENIVTRRLPIIQEFEGFLKTLNPKMSVPQRCLILLYHRGKSGATSSELKQWTKRATKTSGHVPTVLSQLEKQDLIHRDRERNFITWRGIAKAEELLRSTTH